jgi:pimeloyl-ACP methyl ester carboxylesterase
LAAHFSYRAFPKMVELAELLADRFTVINYDRRGRGESGDAQPYAVEREIEDLQVLLDEAGGSASAWGWSSGAVLVLRLQPWGSSSRGSRSASRRSWLTRAIASRRPTSRRVSWSSPARAGAARRFATT